MRGCWRGSPPGCPRTTTVSLPLSRCLLVPYSYASPFCSSCRVLWVWYGSGTKLHFSIIGHRLRNRVAILLRSTPQPVTDDAEVQLRATGIPENTTATTEWGCVASTSGRRDMGGLTVAVLGQPGGDPLQHPCMTQSHAVEGHELAVGWVGHSRQFKPLSPTILAGTCVTSRRRCQGDDSLDQFSQQLHLCPCI